MAKKEASHGSKLYLKIIGIIQIVFAALAIVGLIAFLVSNITITELGLAGQQAVEEFVQAGGTENALKMIIGITGIVIAVIDLLVGILLIRAAKHPKKSTFVLVLIVISVIFGVYGLFSETIVNGFSNISTIVANLISVTIDVFALMSLINIRKEIDK